MKIHIALAVYCAVSALVILSVTVYAICFESFRVAAVCVAFTMCTAPLCQFMYYSVMDEWEHQRAQSREPHADTSAR
jgi:hypothetical protein